MTCFDISETRPTSEKRTARERRVAHLQAHLEKSRATLNTEQDQMRLVQLMKEHLMLQDALLAELMQGHRQHGGHR